MKIADAEQHFTNVLCGLEKEHGVVVVALEIEEINVTGILSPSRETIKRVRIRADPPTASRWDVAP